MPIRATVWGENVHEQTSEVVRGIYPEGMHNTIAAALRTDAGIVATTATLQEPEHGLTERRLVATAAAYVVSPGAMGPVAADPAREVDGKGMDRLSASYLVALAARVVREVGQLLRKSQEVNKRLATLSIDTEVRFRSAEARAAFSNELTAAVAALVARYHDESAPGGRRHRLMIGAYPAPQAPPASASEVPSERKETR